MYLPAYSLLKQSLQGDDDPAVIAMPRDVFRRLLQLMLVASGFDEDWYTSAYDDVSKALGSKAIKSGLVHYSDGGFFEGRRPKVFDVDEDWYLRRYPDVAAGIRAGIISSGHAHYNENGYFEGRVPTPDMEEEIEEWNRLLERNRGIAADPHSSFTRRVRR